MKTLCAFFCGWPDRRGGLKVDSSVMHDSGTGFSANITLMLVIARSACYTHFAALDFCSKTTDTHQETDEPTACSRVCVGLSISQ